MFGFFEGVVGTLQIAVDFIVSLFEGLLTFITEIPRALAFLVSAVVYLPPFLYVFIMPFIGICIILNIINKGS